MAYWYRALDDLIFAPGDVTPRGELVRAEKFKDEATIAILVSKRRISPVATPPLAVLPGWERRAEKLAQADIRNVEDFFETDVKEIAEHMGVTARTVERWKTSLVNWLRPDGG